MAQIPLPTYLSPEWHTQRKHDADGRVRFGASDAPVLMGVSQYKNIVDLFMSRQSTELPAPPNEAQMRGHRLEPALLGYASDVLQEPVTTPDVWFTTGRFVATLDGLSESNVIVECKTTTTYSSDNPIPAPWYWQVQAQLACNENATHAFVAVLDKRMRFGYYDVRRNEDDIAILLDQAEYVGSHFDKGEIPDDVTYTEDQVKRLYPSPTGNVDLSYDQYAMITEWIQLKQQREEIEQKEQDLRNEVVSLLRGAETAKYNGITVVSYKARKGSLRLDTKLLEAEHPDLVGQYKKMSNTTRVLRIHEGK